jgi:hypothetical protein
MRNNGIRSWETLLAEAIGGDAALRVISQSGDEFNCTLEPKRPQSPCQTGLVNNEGEPRRSRLFLAFLGEGI